MDQQIGKELPPIQGLEQQHTSTPPSQETGAAFERTENQAVKATEMAQPNPIQDPRQVAASSAQQTQAFQAQVPLPAGAMPAIADDADLIEKEWVAKAKEIVARTKNDPYQQNKEVEKMKADYLKIRFNKDIKLTED